MLQATMKRAVRISAFALVTTLGAQPLLAQDTSSPSRPFGLDPYKPSDAKILRDFGPALATQMPVSELSKLDPYNPTDAALLRQVGGAIPIWGLGPFWPIAPVVGSPSPFGTPLANRVPIRRAGSPNVVWVCKGSACAGADASTHTFSKPPADVSLLTSGAAPER